MEAANALFSQQRFSEAISAYAAIVNSSATDNVPASMRAQASSNQAAAYMRDENQFAKALAAAERAIELDPTYVKAWGRKGAALHGLKRYEEAYHAYTKGQQTAAAAGSASLTPYQTEVAELVQLLRSNQGIASEDTRRDYYFNKAVKAGTEALKADKYNEAILQYTKALDNLPVAVVGESAATTSDSMSQQQRCRETATLFANRSVAYYKKGSSLTSSAGGAASTSSGGGAGTSRTTTAADVADKATPEALLESSRDAFTAAVCDPSYARAFCRLGMSLRLFQHRTNISNAIIFSSSSSTPTENSPVASSSSSSSSNVTSASNNSSLLIQSILTSSSSSSKSDTSSTSTSTSTSTTQRKLNLTELKECKRAPEADRFFIDAVMAKSRNIIQSTSQVRSVGESRQLLIEARAALHHAIELSPGGNLPLATTELVEVNRGLDDLNAREREEERSERARRDAVAAAVKTRFDAAAADEAAADAAAASSSRQQVDSNKCKPATAAHVPMQRARTHSYQSCRFCNGFGHTAANCPLKAFQQQQQQQQNYKRNRD